jgi:hypothetical protein
MANVSQVLDWARLSKDKSPELWSDQTNKFVDAAYWVMFGPQRAGRSTLMALIALHRAMNGESARIGMMMRDERTALLSLCNNNLPTHLQKYGMIGKHSITCSRLARSSFEDFLRVVDFKLNDEQKKYVDVLRNPRFQEESSGIFIALAILRKALETDKETGFSFPLAGRWVADKLAELTAGRKEFFIHNHTDIYYGSQAEKMRNRDQAKSKFPWDQVSSTNATTNYIVWKFSY